VAFEPFDVDEFFKRMRRMFKEFDREFPRLEKFEREFAKRPGVAGFKIEIKDFGTGRPEIKVARLGERPVEIKPAIEAPGAAKPVEKAVKKVEVKPIARMLETNTAKIEKLDEVILTMHAPEVAKEDVDVRQLGRTLEIIARKPTGEAYFGAFELPPDALPGELSLETKEGMLVIRVPRRRRMPHVGMM